MYLILLVATFITSLNSFAWDHAWLKQDCTHVYMPKDEEGRIGQIQFLSQSVNKTTTFRINVVLNRENSHELTVHLQKYLERYDNFFVGTNVPYNSAVFYLLSLDDETSARAINAIDAFISIEPKSAKAEMISTLYMFATNIAWSCNWDSTKGIDTFIATDSNSDVESIELYMGHLQDSERFVVVSLNTKNNAQLVAKKLRTTLNDWAFTDLSETVTTLKNKVRLFIKSKDQPTIQAAIGDISNLFPFSSAEFFANEFGPRLIDFVNNYLSAQAQIHFHNKTDPEMLKQPLALTISNLDGSFTATGVDGSEIELGFIIPIPHRRQIEQIMPTVIKSSNNFFSSR